MSDTMTSTMTSTSDTIDNLINVVEGVESRGDGLGTVYDEIVLGVLLRQLLTGRCQSEAEEEILSGATENTHMLLGMLYEWDMEYSVDVKHGLLTIHAQREIGGRQVWWWKEIDCHKSYGENWERDSDLEWDGWMNPDPRYLGESEAAEEEWTQLHIREIERFKMEMDMFLMDWMVTPSGVGYEVAEQYQ